MSTYAEEEFVLKYAETAKAPNDFTSQSIFITKKQD